MPPNKLFHSSEQEAGEVASFFFFFFSIKGLKEGFAVDILGGVLVESKRVLELEMVGRSWRRWKWWRWEVGGGGGGGGVGEGGVGGGGEGSG